MPGVPSGRGCQACRAQKKKCDQAVPACSRCLRLRLPCVGAGQQRFVFKEQQVAKPSKANAVGSVLRVRNAPSNATTSTVNGLVWAMAASTDMRYNLVWTYGGFLEEVPRRLGFNEALDASARALVDAHANVSLRRGVTVSVLNKYSRALSVLRLYLDDPAKARSIETLCAVMLLLICQSFIGVTERRWTGHSEGATRILKARGFYNPEDEFESALLLSLRGPVLFEAILNPQIQLSSWEWKFLVENHLDGSSLEGRMLLCLSRVPDQMRRGRAVLWHKAEDAKLLQDMTCNYDAFKDVLAGLHERLLKLQETHTPTDFKACQLCPTDYAYAHFQRTYGIALAIGIVISCVLSAVDVGNTQLIKDQSHFADEILDIADHSAQYKPLWTSYLSSCLITTWSGTTDPSKRLRVVKALDEYSLDFSGSQETARPTALDLERISRRLHLLDWETFPHGKFGE